jgi:hypothetical protein
VVLVWSGAQIALGVFEWRQEASHEFLPTLAVFPLIAAGILLTGLCAFRFRRPAVQEAVVLALVFGAFCQIVPILESFSSLIIAMGHAMAGAALALMAVVHLLTLVLLVTLAVALHRSIPDPRSDRANESPFLCRPLVESEREWKPEPQPLEKGTGRMPLGTGIGLAVLLVLGTVIGFWSSNRFTSKADEAWNPYVHSDTPTFTFFVVHPYAMFLLMFVVIAALARSTAHRKLARVLLWLAIGLQVLIVVGMVV